MENLKFGWRQSSRSGMYHYVPDYTSRDTHTLRSLCWKFSMDRVYARTKEFLEKFEILDVSEICHICELKLKNRQQNDFKKEILEEINKIPTHDGYVLKKATCSEESCNNSGVAFVSVNNPNDNHYCTKHNLQVTETVRQEKEVIL